MGLPSQLATILLREHRYRPIEGTFLSIGRQTAYFSPAEAVALVRCELGSPPLVAEDALEIDASTRGCAGQSFISDRAFYSLFSRAEYRCLDINAYEGADIVADLCAPIDRGLDGRFDFIFDGSCLDNMFDPATAIRNLAQMLKPGGRIVHVDRASRRHNVYVAFALSWFHDFYAINDFADCQVYLAQWDGEQSLARWDFYHYEPARMRGGRLSYFGQDCWYHPWREAHAVVIAEKGERSTSDRSPVQFEYRPQLKLADVDGRREIAPQDALEEAHDPYVASALRFRASRRPLLLRPEEKVAIPKEILHYSPETVYCGSIPSIGEHLGRTRAGRLSG
jgi:SAM-dependent methyltransferase